MIADIQGGTISLSPEEAIFLANLMDLVITHVGEDETLAQRVSLFEGFFRALAWIEIAKFHITPADEEKIERHLGKGLSI